MRFLAILITTIFICSATIGQTIEARSAFKQGYELLGAGQQYQAINSFKLALSDASFPLLDYTYYYIAEAYKQKQNWQQAIQVYEIIPKYFKNSLLAPKAIVEIGQIKSDINEPEAAMAILRKFINENPKHELAARARYLLGVNLIRTSRNEEAAQVLRNVDALHPDSYFAEKALEQLDKLAKTTDLAIYEAPAATIYNLGIKYFKLGNVSRAKEYFTRLTKYYTKSVFYDEANLMLGRIQLRQNKLNSAANYFQKTIGLDKDSKPEAMFYLARTYAYQDSLEAAIGWLEKVSGDFPRHHISDDALYYLAKYYKQTDQTDKLAPTWQKLVERYPDSEYFDEASWAIGSSFYKQGDFNRANEIFKKINSARTLFWSAKSLERANKKDAAIEAYKLTINRFNHSYYAYRAREELSRFGVEVKIAAIPDVSEEIEKIATNIYEAATHEKKYQELLAAGLADEAAAEAEFLEEKVPLAQKEKASLAKYHAYVSKGKFAKAINFAEKKIAAAGTSGTLSQLDPRLWRFSYPRGYQKYVEKFSKARELDPYLTYAVIREESHFQSQALSSSAAHGLMQIIPGTGRLIANALGMRYSRWNMYQPRVNIDMGTYYLASLVKRFDGNIPLALAGYNGGPNRVQKWLKEHEDFDLDEFVEDIPITETRNYVKKVMTSYYGYQRTYSTN